jgi:uracil-DNA glycosylase family 4
MYEGGKGQSVAVMGKGSLRGDPTDAHRLALLGAMGIDVWVPRALSVAVEPSALKQPAALDAAGTPGLQTTMPSEVDWKQFRSEVSACQRCRLCQTRTQTVFGTGSVGAEWMFIGEAPGAEEDAQGEPFVGRAGKLLNNMLRAIGIQREQVYIANILKCRPPKNRDPQPDEAAACRAYLNRQIAWIRPKIIVALGRVAAQNLLATDTAIGRLRGREHRYEGVPLIVTYHPAYLLRSPLEKRKAWDDLLFAARISRQARHFAATV